MVNLEFFFFLVVDALTLFRASIHGSKSPCKLKATPFSSLQFQNNSTKFNWSLPWLEQEGLKFFTTFKSPHQIYINPHLLPNLNQAWKANPANYSAFHPCKCMLQCSNQCSKREPCFPCLVNSEHCSHYCPSMIHPNTSPIIAHTIAMIPSQPATSAKAKNHPSTYIQNIRNLDVPARSRPARKSGSW